MPHLALKPKSRKTNYTQKGREKEIAFPAKQVRVEWVSKHASVFLNFICKQQRPTDDTCKEKRLLLEKNGHFYRQKGYSFVVKA